MDIELSDQDLFSFDNARRAALLRELNEKDFVGLGLCAPATAEVDALRPLPAVLVSSITALDHWRFDIPRTVTLLAIEQGGDGLWVGEALPAPPGRDESDLEWGPAPEGNDATAIYMQAPLLDARGLLGLPPRPLKLALHALGFDRSSKAAYVSLVEPLGARPPIAAVPPAETQARTRRYPSPPQAHLGQVRDAPALKPGELAARVIQGPTGRLEALVAATGSCLTVLVARARQRGVVGYELDLQGQPYASLDLEALTLGETSIEGISTYLISGSALLGPLASKVEN